MSSVIAQMLSVLTGTFEGVDDELMHYGTKRHSGRYPWGSGDNPYQHGGDFMSRVQELRKSGMSEKDIAKAMGLESTTELRVEYRIAKNERRAYEVDTAKSLKDKGYSNIKIAEMMGLPGESSVRSLLNEHSETRMNQAKVTADFLKKQIEEKGMIDVGIGVERELGISRTKMDEALYMLEREGYMLYGGGLPQVTNPGKQTNLQVLCPPGTDHKDIYDFENVHSITDYRIQETPDGTDMVRRAFQYPESLDSSRLSIVYGDQGGTQKDGVIELRRGVADLSLGESHYAQVRILVDGTHYLKGMAVYADDLPDGVDVRFNTNKNSGTPMEKVLKPITSDPDNPFGSLIKEDGGQSYYTDKDGKQKLSLINKRSDEGDWGNWDDTLPSQFLAKQNYGLIKKQIGLSMAGKQAEFEEICSLTNPTVKRNLLKSFADDCDSTAVHLDAAALPRQKWHVILPVPSMKETEVYAPQYNNGEKVALIRYPHGGTFEIPVLTVNNKIADAQKMVPLTSRDAVCINSKVAERLSGADFDGDTVMLIPTHDSAGKVKITSTNPLKGLEGFDPKMEYYREPSKRDKSGNPVYDYKIMSKGATQKEMGVISNLITDMTLKGATQDELARAVRHSMVVIDANKHKLDYKQSEVDNGIASLKQKYQGHIGADGKYHEGAGTIISRAKSETSVPERQGQAHINLKGTKWYDPNVPEGAYVYNESGRVKTTVRKDGSVKEELRTTKSTKMAETHDARTLVSDSHHPVEELYASYANGLKSLANNARVEMMATGRIKYNASAAETYRREVDHLTAQLNVCKMNAPKERQAQRIANSVVAAKKQDNPDMTKKEIKKAGQQALVSARQTVGAQRTPISISEREWHAIQAGAISDSKLSEILTYADPKTVRSYATPRTTTSLSSAKVGKIKAMNASNYTIKEIADALGVSTSTVSKYL